jgi:5-methyltetrahydropteroyltriglutamate--homocysteine methyltransferase
MDWSFNEYYRNRETATFALAREIRKEVEALMKAGTRIIQIDEPALSTRPEEVKMALRALRSIVEGLNAYFITHCCYGEFHKIYHDIRKYLPVDNLDIEMSNSNLDLLEAMRNNPLRKDISFGVVDVHSHIVEDVETVKRRILSALEVIGKERLWVDPDCGLKTRTVDEAVGKMKVISEAARLVRDQVPTR